MRIFNILFFFLMANYCFGQDCISGVIILDEQEEVDNFPSIYPNCTVIEDTLIIRNSDISNLDSLYRLTEIGRLEIRNTEKIKNLHGFEQVEEIGTLLISNNFGLDSIIGFDHLAIVHDQINISGNNNLLTIKTFQNLEKCGGIFLDNFSLVNLIAFDQLKEVNGAIFMRGENLPNYPEFPNLEIVTSNIFISGPMFETIDGFNKLRSVYRIDIVSSEQLLTINGFNKLESVTDRLEISRNDKLIEVDGFESLRTVGSLRFDFLDSLETIPNFDELKILTNGLGITNTHKLEALPSFKKLERIQNFVRIDYNRKLLDISSLAHVDLNSLISLTLTSNWILEQCSMVSICEYLFQSNSNFDLVSSLGNCQSIESILDNCDNFAKVVGTNYYDENENGIFDMGEAVLGGINIKVDPADRQLISNVDGEVLYLSSTNNETVIFSLEDDQWISPLGILSDTIYIADSTVVDSFSFGLVPAEFNSKLELSINSTPLRCDSWRELSVCITNVGTTIASGTLFVTIDSLIDSIDFVNIPDHMDMEHLYGWDYTNLYPGQSYSETVHILVPGILEVPSGFLNFKSFSEYSDQLGPNETPTFKYNGEVRCSFDPNDKLVQPDREGEENYTLFEESLTYTIRFQNTGNDVAYDIQILDTLDTQLDISTFKFLASSHSENLEISIVDENILNFDFKRIFLPDSTNNEPNSHGFITYNIKPNGGLGENSLVQNSASIYFDQNPAVITNTVVNTLVSMIPSSADDLEFAPKIDLYPNPTTDILWLQVDPLIEGKVRIVNILGHVVQELDLKSALEINMQDNPSGIFFLNIQSLEGSWTRQFYFNQ